MKQWVKFLLISLVSSLLLSSCDESEKSRVKPNDSLAKGISPDQTGWNIEVKFVDTSFTKAILNTGRTRVFQQRMETYLDYGLKVQFFSKKSGQRVSLLTADSAIIDDKTKNMVAKGVVRVVADSSGTVLQTSALYWDNKTMKIYTTEYVQITTRTETIQGYGFESDQNLTNYKIYKVSGIQR
jgi:LPS export ABC transporter protein LptC